MQRPILRNGQGSGERQEYANGLVRPGEWGRPRWNVRAAISIVVAAVVSVLAFVGGLSSAGSGFGPESRFFLILSALMLLTAAFGCVLWWPRRGAPGVRTLRRGGLGAGTEVRSRMSVFVALVSMVGCAAALAVGAAVEVFLFNNGIPWVSLVLALLGVPCVAFVIEVALGRLAVGALVLSADGIRQRGWSFESYLPWMSVAGVQALDFGYPETWVEGTTTAAWARRRTSALFRLDRFPETPRIEIDSRRYAVDAVLLHRMLEFYTCHPAARSELGTPRAVERFRRADLRVPDRPGE
ncbi:MULTISPECIES: hypothetical protein [unclassified Rhodococcus (in: high G+C Gram-positive bacteria)]|uniref:hypothetical protein n=1 Tax=Rhodococcus sp. SJ-3 TaxID=3454628 RepID=UPI002D8E0697|nr:hypothetical protein [Rhodococcus sp. (in: high G+C Gram-positive bacteria)]